MDGSNKLISEEMIYAFRISLLLLAVYVCGWSPTSAQNGSLTGDGIEDVYLARDDGNGQPGEVVTEFRSDDIPIHCVVLLSRAAVATVKMNFIAVRVAGVKPETKVVSSSYKTRAEQDRVNFTGKPYGKWNPGTYRMDLFLDDKPVRNVTFVITGAAAGPSAPRVSVPQRNQLRRTRAPVRR